MSVDIERRPLDKTSLKILLTASRIAFRHSCGESSIEGIHEHRLRESYRTIVPVAAEFRIYGDHKMEDPEKNASCFVLTSGGLENEVGSFLRTIKPDDEVRLRWVRDNNNGYVNKAGLHVDELRGVIRRKTRSGKVERFEFLLDVSICADNSARMIRRA